MVCLCFSACHSNEEEAESTSELQSREHCEEKQIMSLWNYFLNYASNDALPGSSIAVARRLDFDLFCHRPWWQAQRSMEIISQGLYALGWECIYADHENMHAGEKYAYQALIAINKLHREREMHMFMHCNHSASYTTAICMYSHTEGRGECKDVKTFFGRDKNFLETVERKLDKCETMVMVFPSNERSRWDKIINK